MKHKSSGDAVPSGRTIALLSLVASLWLCGLTSGVAGASATSGKAEITQPGQNTALDSGGSATLFGLSVPASASCAGDTEHDGYHVFTFLFPAGVAPTDVSFKTGVPAGFGSAGRFGLISLGQYVGGLDTAPVTGQLVRLPSAYSWARLTAKDLFTGGRTSSTWEAGLACANTDGVVTNYWATEVLFRASTGDPGGFSWLVPKSAQVALTDPPSNPVGIILVVVAVVLAVIAVIMNRRRKSTGNHVVR